MTKEIQPVDIQQIRTIPELVQLAEEVRASRRPRMLTLNHEPLVVVQPVGATRTQRGRALTKDDPLFSIIGAGHSEGPADVSTNKHHYLAEAYFGKRP